MQRHEFQSITARATDAPRRATELPRRTTMRIAAATITLTMAPRAARRATLRSHTARRTNAEGRIQGTLDTSVLTARGVRQAQELGATSLKKSSKDRQGLGVAHDPCCRRSRVEKAAAHPRRRALRSAGDQCYLEVKCEVMDAGRARWKADPASFIMDDGAAALIYGARRATGLRYA